MMAGIPGMRCLGGCLPLFFGAFLLDVVGLTVIFVGIFANLRVDGRFYGDFLIYTGSLLIFFSLALWLMWYVVNVPVKEDGGGGGGWRTSSSGGSSSGGSVMDLARKLSERLSQKMKDASSSAPSPAPDASAWSPPGSFSNHGYDSSTDAPSPPPPPPP